MTSSALPGWTPTWRGPGRRIRGRRLRLRRPGRYFRQLLRRRLRRRPAAPNATPRGAKASARSVSVDLRRPPSAAKKEVTVERASSTARPATATAAPTARRRGLPRLPRHRHRAQAAADALGCHAGQGPCQRCRGTGKIIHQPCPSCAAGAASASAGPSR